MGPRASQDLRSPSPIMAPGMNANLAQSRGNPFHFRTQNYRSLMLGYQKEQVAEKPQKNS